jgi:hypothetical protein
MKLFIASLLLVTAASAFAQESERCNGGQYWALMEQSQRICNWQAQVFEQQTGLSCSLKWHNSPTVCWNNCVDANGMLKARQRVDMTGDCDWGKVEFRKTKVTWYR